MTSRILRKNIPSSLFGCAEDVETRRKHTKKCRSGPFSPKSASIFTPLFWEFHHPSPPLYFRVFIVCVAQDLPGRSLAFDNRCKCTVNLPLCIVVIYLFHKLNFVNIRAKIYKYCVFFYLFIYFYKYAF